VPEAARYALLFGLGALLSGLTILNGINPHDEGLVLQAAARVADGELPYGDFYANYGPGQYFLAGGLDWVFGPSLLSWRVVRVALDALVAVLAYAIARRDAPEPLALGTWIAVVAVMAHPTLPHPNAPALALAFGAILLARRSPAGAGVLAGAAFAFRFDLGAAAAVGVAIAAADRGVPPSAATAEGPARGAFDRGAALRAAAAAAATAALLVAPFALAAPGDFWDQTVGFALDEQSLQRLPLPGSYDGGFEPNKVLAFYMPYVLMGGLALWLLVSVARRAPLRLWAPFPLALAGLAYLLARADEFHLVPLAAVLPVLLATAAGREWPAGRRLPTAALALPLVLVALDGLDKNRIDLIDAPPLAAIDLDAADGVKARPDEARALERLVDHVRERVPAGRPVFVANPRHDLVRAGNPLVYVLADRPNPTRYDVMQPGVVTTAPVQREIVRDLRRSGTELVVRWLSPVAAEAEPNGAGDSSGVRVLDRYLARGYAEVERFGDYAVLRLRRPDSGAE
jgi:hypothetical protein